MKSTGLRKPAPSPSSRSSTSAAVDENECPIEKAMSLRKKAGGLASVLKEVDAKK